MDFMLDKLKVHPNGDEIIKTAYEMVEKIEKDDRFNDSEKLLVIDLVVTKINYDLYKVSGDKSK